MFTDAATLAGVVLAFGAGQIGRGPVNLHKLRLVYVNPERPKDSTETGPMPVRCQLDAVQHGRF